MDIMELLKITPENLAAQQHATLKKHVIESIEHLKNLIESEQYADIVPLLELSGAGDGYGQVNYNYYFNFGAGKDIGDVIQMLYHLKRLAYNDLTRPAYILKLDW